MKRMSLLFLSLIVIFSSMVKAQDYAASVKVSTLGVSVEALRSFGHDFNARVGFAFFSYSMNGGGGNEDYTYDASAKLKSLSFLADYFPFSGSFRITGGLFVNLNKAQLDMVPTKSYTIGGDTYSPDKLGNLKADVTFKKFVPYIGIGFGNPTDGGSGLSVTFDVGTVYQGPANIDLSATGLLEPSASPDQEEKLESNISWFKWYPVISLGLVYEF